MWSPRRWKRFSQKWHLPNSHRAVGATEWQLCARIQVVGLMRRLRMDDKWIGKKSFEQGVNSIFMSSNDFQFFFLQDFESGGLYLESVTRKKKFPILLIIGIIMIVDLRKSSSSNQSWHHSRTTPNRRDIIGIESSSAPQQASPNEDFTSLNESTNHKKCTTIDLTRAEGIVAWMWIDF